MVKEKLFTKMSRKKIVAGNWKMNLVSEEAILLVDAIAQLKHSDTTVELMVFPPALYIQALKNTSLKVGAQNFHPAEKGAFTGELSLNQLKDVGASIVLIGHSERRELFLESNSFLKEKVDAAIAHKMPIIFCCGEPLSIREAGTALEFVTQQLTESLFHLSPAQLVDVTIAYEPIWAIGTGKTATVEEAEAMHKGIRAAIEVHYQSSEIAASIPILYGGSCNATNATELFACPNVDGGLIGGAALDASSFIAIANAF
jgi:triosephosphate isomerase